MDRDPIGDALRADAEAARNEIRAAGLTCPSCDGNAGDLYGRHSLVLIPGSDPEGLPEAECRDGQRVTVYNPEAAIAAVNIAFLDDVWFSEANALRNGGFPA